MERRRHFSGARWEPEIGYCRAVRAGDLEVKALIDPAMTIEIEADAVVSHARRAPRTRRARSARRRR